MEGLPIWRARPETELFHAGDERRSLQTEPRGGAIEPSHPSIRFLQRAEDLIASIFSQRVPHAFQSHRLDPGPCPALGQLEKLQLGSVDLHGWPERKDHCAFDHILELP